MATIKSYTAIEQSKKLAEFLPLESADMLYYLDKDSGRLISDRPFVRSFKETNTFTYIPCWSLAALLEIIPFCQVNKMTNSNKWEASSWKNSNLVPKYYVEGFDTTIDACYELVLKLNELKML